MKAERLMRVAVVACLGLALFLPAVSAQVMEPAQAEEADTSVGPDGVEVTADRLEYEAERKLMIGIGNVVVTHGEDVLKADCVTVHTETKEAYATGNVWFDRGGKQWTGDELTYNFETEQGDFGQSEFFMDPFYVTADDSERVAAEEYVLDNARITTCEGDDPGFHIRASSARVFGDTLVKARNVVIFLGPIPVFYMPFAKYDVERKTNFDFLPGFSSRLGAYALMAYNYRLNKYLYASTHLDVYSRRGLGYGQDFKWASSNTFAGKVQTYYIDDDEPYRDKEEEQAQQGLVEEERYRVKLQHKNWYTERLTLNIDAHYLSDPEVTEDFFREEYREEAEPENRAVLTYRGDKFTAALKLERRLNDFYETVDRTPEASLDILRQQIGSTRFYYEGENSAVALERQFSEQSERDSYDAFRFDTFHMLYYPTRHFGFLNVIPRAGYRGTYYSKTIESTQVTNLVTVTETNEVGGMTNVLTYTTNETSTVISEGDADIRNLPEIGLELSFKAFKVLRPATLGMDGGLRHVVEPYANYTYIPEPDLTPENIWQFDDIDELGEDHRIRLGLRNKFQTKKSERIWDLVDVDVSVDYFMDPDEDQEDFGPVNFDAELRPSEYISIDFDGEYDTYETQVTEFNTQVALIAPDETSLAVEYRYLLDRRDQIAAEFILLPNMRYSLGAYMRYDLETSHVEEQSYYIQRQTSCMGWALGYEGRGSDWDFTLRLWLTAFPDSVIETAGHY